MISRKMRQFGLPLFSLCLLLSYLDPFHVHPLRVFYNDLLIFVGLFCGFLFCSQTTKQKLKISFVAYLFVALIIVDQLRLVFSESIFSHESFIRDFYFACAALACIFGANDHFSGSKSTNLYSTIALAHLLAALLSIIMQGIQIAGIDATPWVMFIAPDAQPFMRPYANVAQPNQLALLFCFALASVWYLLFLIWGISLTQSRIGWIILPLFVVIDLARVEGQRRVSAYLSAGFLLVYAGLVVSLPSVGRLLGFASGSVLEHVGGRSERLVLWQQAWRMAAQHPWFGVGWGRFGAEQVQMAADFSTTIYAEHSHNLILNFAAELGWPLTIVLFGFLAWWLVQTCVLPKASLNVRFATLCFVAVGVHSMVEYPLWYAYVLIPIALLMGAVHRERWPEGVGIPVPTLALRSISVIGLLVLALVTWDYQRVVQGFGALRARPGTTSLENAALQPPSVTIFGQYFDYFKVFKLPPHEGMSVDEIAFVERMSQRFGFVHVLNKLAEVYVLNGQPVKAARTMQSLQRLHPFAYPEYFDYWKTQSRLDERYRKVFQTMPPRDSQ
jgi:O-antigen ligase